jgi:hypothetical protein
MDRKPLGIKSYGTIPHLEGSRITPSDKHCHEGQTRIATIKPRDRHDVVIVQEKVDGSNVGVALFNGEILALTRAGYLAHTSPYEQHWHWDNWVKANESRFRYVLNEGERICGEWIMQTHGTKYNLWHEPFVAFDLMKEHERLPVHELQNRLIRGNFVMPHILHEGQPITIDYALSLLGEHGFHGAIDKAEGCVWRVERQSKVDFLVKFVRPDKTDGIYLPEVSKQQPVWNWFPNGYQLQKDKSNTSTNRQE